MIIQDGGARERSIIRPASAGDVNVVSENKVLVVNCWEH